MSNKYHIFTETELNALSLSRETIPEHVGIIMDGNGRWARKRLLPRTAGHKAGVEALRAILPFTHSVGIKALTVYAFSTENWQRPRTEVEALFSLLIDSFRSEIDELDKSGVCIRIIGDIAPFNGRIKDVLEAAQDRTKNNKTLYFNIAFNYGSRSEIVHAVNELIMDGVNPGEVTEEMLESKLYTFGLPKLDLIIRTAGEQRLSNFLLWQAAYAEFVFTDTLFPDFNTDVYAECLREFARRTRRFGKVL